MVIKIWSIATGYVVPGSWSSMLLQTLQYRVPVVDGIAWGFVGRVREEWDERCDACSASELEVDCINPASCRDKRKHETWWAISGPAYMLRRPVFGVASTGGKIRRVTAESEFDDLPRSRATGFDEPSIIIEDRRRAARLWTLCEFDLKPN